MMQVEAEVFRLEELKASKMKELVFKKRSELEEICRKTHMIPESDSAMESAVDAIEAGMESCRFMHRGKVIVIYLLHINQYHCNREITPCLICL